MERYIVPVCGFNKNGFAMMAIACLMIEAFQSLRMGLEHTRGNSREIFAKFFEEERSLFGVLADHSDAFYSNVRCGILHQAETTRGWKIRRSGELFDNDRLSINATKFLKLLKSILSCFCEMLAQSDWDTVQWQLVRAKLAFICEHCSPDN